MNKLLSGGEIFPPELVTAIADLQKTKKLLQAVKAVQAQAAAVQAQAAAAKNYA